MPSRRRRRAAAAVISTLGALGLGVFLVARAGHAPDARDDVDAPASARSASAPVAAAAPAPEAPEPRPPADAQATPPVALPSAAPEAPAAEPRAARPTKQRGVRATDHGVVPQARSPRDEGAASSEPVPRIRDEASVADPPPPPPGEPARLNVNAIPWAEVRVDGRLVGETPVFGLRVPSGAHVIELRNPALGVDRRIEIDLAAGESREVVIELR